MAQATTTAAAAVAFEDFFETERLPLFRALCLMTGDRDEAEELAAGATATSVSGPMVHLCLAAG